MIDVCVIETSKLNALEAKTKELEERLGWSKEANIRLRKENEELKKVVVTRFDAKKATDRIKELEGINDGHRKINGDLRVENESLRSHNQELKGLIYLAEQIGVKFTDSSAALPDWHKEYAVVNLNACGQKRKVYYLFPNDTLDLNLGISI